MEKKRKISVVIPTFNEEAEVFEAVQEARKRVGEGVDAEVIVVDGKSSDETLAEAERAGAKIVVSEVARRSWQMNRGAEAAVGDVLYFLHADCRPPQNYGLAILESVADGHGYGCFRRKVGDEREDDKALGFISFVSRFRGPMFRGGDASLFVDREVFESAGGFNDEMVLMEDFEILPRLRKRTRFRLLPDYVIASNRKHIENGFSWRVHFASILVWSMYYTGFGQNSLLKTYRYLIRGAKYHK